MVCGSSRGTDGRIEVDRSFDEQMGGQMAGSLAGWLDRWMDRQLNRRVADRMNDGTGVQATGQCRLADVVPIKLV